MDGLVLIACTVLFLLLVVIPVMSILAYRRSNAARDELSRLRQRVALLEQQMSGYAPGHAPAAQEAVSPVDSPEVIVPDVFVPEVSVPEPQPTPEPEPVPIEPAPVNVWARGTPAATVSARGSVPLPEREEPASGSQAGGMVTALLCWFMQGNPLAKLGIILLFLGLAFLFRYSVERSLFPLELRLAVAALGAMALLFLGWRLRHKQPVFALILQGGATGAHYLTVFGAFRLWQMLPMSLAFALLLLISRGQRRAGGATARVESGHAGESGWLCRAAAAVFGWRQSCHVILFLFITVCRHPGDQRLAALARTQPVGDVLHLRGGGSVGYRRLPASVLPELPALPDC